uniref:Uncharacterized protein n=1 Tax=Spodoptera frugiperda ascovirus 1a TaxID=113370 RepID=Q9DKM1_SFAVA|nr:hypothetical protein [Spodoptera frugiperda ascovirus 1a]
MTMGVFVMRAISVRLVMCAHLLHSARVRRLSRMQYLDTTARNLSTSALRSIRRECSSFRSLSVTGSLDAFKNLPDTYCSEYLGSFVYVLRNISITSRHRTPCVSKYMGSLGEIFPYVLPAVVET